MIRRAQLQDYRRLTALWLTSCRKAHDFIAADYWQKMSLSVERDYFPHSETYVYEDKHQLKGFISLLENNFIGALFVMPQYQNQRVGSKLLRFVRRHRPHLSLKVFVQNRQALAFYQKHDFKIIAEQVDVSTKQKELLLGWAVGCLSGFQPRRQGDS